jgi:hypothetical protein
MRHRERHDLRIAFITTVGHNVGDDLVREGIRHLLEVKLGPIVPMLIHKHFPATVRSELSWLQDKGITQVIDSLTGGKSRAVSRLIDSLPLRTASDKVLRSDLLVQCGAPVYWCFPDGSGSHSNEWFHPLIERRYTRVRNRVPLLNLGAGSCQPYHSNGTEFTRNAECITYIRKLHDLSAVTTVRDSLARSILNLFGLDAPLLACPSIFARDRLGVAPVTREFVALNFMPLGGHYDLGQKINSDRWQKTFVVFCRTLLRAAPAVLVCHNHLELRLAATLLPDVPRFLVDSAAKCLSIYSRALCFMGSRVHGALATASFGRPAFVIGSDSRTRMAEELMISSGFVSDMSVDLLMAEFGRLQLEAEKFSTVASIVKERTFEGYMDALSVVENRTHPEETTAGRAGE